MAIRNIRKIGDSCLRKECKLVDKMTERIEVLINDMLDTMYDANGVGLAAPQVGILKSICVVDVSEDGDTPYILINPVITETEGEQTGEEGCLSVPGKQGVVTRPMKVKVSAFNERMERFTIEAEGLLARALCHEIDHLHGTIYVDKVDGELKDTNQEE